MKNLTRQNPEQLFVAQELINKVKSKCCGIKVKGSWYGIINTTSKAKPDEIVTIPLEEYMKSLSNNNLQ